MTLPAAFLAPSSSTCTTYEAQRHANPAVPAPPSRPPSASSAATPTRYFRGTWLVDPSMPHGRDQSSRSAEGAAAPSPDAARRPPSSARPPRPPPVSFHPLGSRRVQAIRGHAQQYRFDLTFRPRSAIDLMAEIVRTDSPSSHRASGRKGGPATHLPPAAAAAEAATTDEEQRKRPRRRFHVPMHGPLNSDLRMASLRHDSLGDHLQPFVEGVGAMTFRDSEGRQQATLEDAWEAALAARKAWPTTPRSVANFFSSGKDDREAFEKQDVDFYRRLLSRTVSAKDDLPTKTNAAPSRSPPASSRSTTSRRTQ